ncbi:MAG: hypothetical protein IJH37_12460 [Clostridia bacterium]|nr:hypothetical protein [Clostridia bacterium]
MKKSIISMLLVSAVTLSTTAFAAAIPRETAPQNATEEQIVIVENIIGDILDEVAAGNLGFTEAAGYANARVRKAVIAGETNGNGYTILAAIIRNAVLDLRCTYLRNHENDK